MKEVLIIDDNQESAFKLERFLKAKGYAPICVDNVDQGLENINESESLKVVLLNVTLSEMKGLDALSKIKCKHREVIVIVLGASAETARKAVWLGALDVTQKIIDTEEIPRILDQAFSRLIARDKTFPIRTGEVTKDQDYLVGESAAMFELNKKIGRVTRDTNPVLLQGETGTGKGLVAHLIHKEGQRSAAPFISIEPDELRESELFGYEKGAFTGAKSEGKPGRFELADGGTLFLDEISNMTPALQATLLSVLQTQEIGRLGSTRTRKIDVRIIAATNKDLAKMVEQGTFRDDLFHRLKGYDITLAPLRERKEDIPLLVAHFLQHIQNQENRPLHGISEKVIKLLQDYDWPGNVRELENCLKSAAVSSQGEVILPNDLPHDIRVGGQNSHTLKRSPEIQVAKTSETAMDENLFDLSVVVFCRFISDIENITEMQIKSWSQRLTHYAHRGANSAKHEIHRWTQAWKNGFITSTGLLTDIEKVVKKAVTRLSALQYGTDFKHTEAHPISIEGKTLIGSLIAVLQEVVKEYGNDREKAAKMLQMDPKKLDGWLNIGREVKRETSKKPSRELNPFPDKEVESLLIKSLDHFVTEQFSRAEWRAKNLYEQIRTVYLGLKSVASRIVGDHGCIYFGGMTFEQIQKQIYRRAAYLYNDETEAAEALDVDVRTFRKYWYSAGSENALPNHYTLF